MYSSTSKVMKAGINSRYGGAPFTPGGSGSGAVFVHLRDMNIPPRHDHWFEVLPPWDSQILAVALAAISTGKNVDVYVGESGVNGEVGPSSEPILFTIHLINS